MSDVQRPTIFIVAGEASGDQHGAMLAQALLERAEVSLAGVGQQRMRQAGVELLFDSTGWSAIGVMEALRRVPKLLLRARQMIRWLSQHPPDLVVLVDFGAFNVRLGHQLKKKQDVPILYYFPPRSWSRSARGFESLARIADRVATPFPWSAELLRASGIDATWVGHPVVDRISPPDDRGPVRAKLGLDPHAPVVGILPGSRPAEIGLIAPLSLGAAKIVRRALPDAQFVISVAPTIKPKALEAQVRRAGLGGVRLAPGTSDIVRAADLAISCCGTATLEATAAGCPMVVVYRGTALMRLEYLLRPPKLEHVAMPNIIAERRVVPELLDREATPAAVAEAALSLLGDPDRLAQTRRELLEVRGTLGPPEVSGRVAEIALEMTGIRHQTSDIGPRTNG